MWYYISIKSRGGEKMIDSTKESRKRDAIFLRNIFTFISLSVMAGMVWGCFTSFVDIYMPIVIIAGFLFILYVLWEKKIE